MVAEYRDPRPLAQAAILWTWIWLGIQALGGVASAITFTLLVTHSFDTPVTVVDATSDWRLSILLVVTLLPYLVSGFLVLSWIHRTNSNAQAYSTGMKVSPGWNVAFFFVPIVNLWKPFQGIRQSWEVAHMHDQSVPDWMRWWWGCWLAVNFIFSTSLAMGRPAENVETVAIAVFLNTLGAIVSVPLALLLIRLIRTLTAAQEAMHREECFV
jgi:hypothetical protein